MHQLKAAIDSLYGEIDELVAMKLQGLTRQQMIQVIYVVVAYCDSSLCAFDPKIGAQAYSEASVIVDLWLPGTQAFQWRKSNFISMHFF